MPRTDKRNIISHCCDIHFIDRSSLFATSSADSSWAWRCGVAPFTEGNVMSSISSVGSGAAIYTPAKPVATTTKPATTTASTAGKDRDHDGDTDKGGVDVNG
jgi:hypothetical protein